MARLISCFLGTPSDSSEGEVMLGTRLDQAFVVSDLPAILDFSIYLEVRREAEDEDGEATRVEVSLEAPDFVLPIGTKEMPHPHRGEDWPFPADALIEFVTEVHVADEGDAFVVVRLDGETVETKWIRVVRSEFAEAY